ncbi:ADAM 8 precursor [Corynespora cassiicola Philippines]|uniref:Disintegrin and metalloproteinase domain-containing protein B n=1 Tax=Corynespora cassiicola Philippines TaxID=1448308 RepID=A0A2T2NU65_CORCC|nr:ADAM 8 precursor [Corynespora cassiicola Philippines]
MLILRAVTTVIALFFAALATASSNARSPLRAIGLVKNPSILTPNHRVTALSTFDVAFDYSGQRFRLSLEPSHDIFVEGAVVHHLDADGRIVSKEPLNRLDHKVFKGVAWVKRGNRWDNVGWARVDVQRDGPEPLFEGTFTVNHDHHHVKRAANFQQTRMDEDPEVELRPEDYLIIFRDSDMGIHDEHTELKKRSTGLACGSDELGFNQQEDHPVYASMRARSESDKFFSMPFSSLMGKRQLDNSPGGGNGAGVNLVSSIGSTDGCPTTRRVALVGVAADCTYIQAHNSSRDDARANIIQQMNSASELFESTFNISLGLANLVLTDPNCPTSVQQATPWNQGCSDSITIQQRLNLFSQWRGQQDDDFSHWTLLSTCNTGSAVGLAWLGQACVAGSQGSNSSDGNAETVAGANVVIKTSTEWQVLAHETGHTYGAVHDCTSETCGDSNIVSSQQCCPLSSSTCDAGERFIMNPSTAQGIERFSACSIGNICSAMARNSVRSGCLSNNRGVTTITGETCGNGIVEGDEECDCGGEAGCGDNQCCDPGTCRFRNNAVCDDSNEDCCRDCQFASSSTVCRPSSGDCDPQETCTGSSPYCPADETRNDGDSCGNGLQCASGQCTSRDQQCKTVMGSYTQGNDTYACDNSNCMLSCASPEFGSGVCYGLQQNFLDGTPCQAGGRCQNGRCAGSSVTNEVKSWIDDNKTLVIGLAAGIGGLFIFCIMGCCWRSYKRRKNRKAYAAAYRGPPPQFQPNGAFQPSRSRSGGRRGAPEGPPGPMPMGQTSPTGSNGPLISQQHGGFGGPNQWQPQTDHGIPEPPPMYQRSNSVRYA